MEASDWDEITSFCLGGVLLSFGEEEDANTVEACSSVAAADASENDSGDESSGGGGGDEDGKGTALQRRSTNERCFETQTQRTEALITQSCRHRHHRHHVISPWLLLLENRHFLVLWRFRGALASKCGLQLKLSGDEDEDEDGDAQGERASEQMLQWSEQ